MSLAVLDLGSNSFSLLVVDRAADGSLIQRARERESVLLGARVALTGHIDQVAWRRSMVAIAGLVGQARLMGASRLVAVATGALGEADNGVALIAAAARQFDMEVELLSPSEAARLTYLGVRAELPASFGRLAVIDVGGGSISVAVGESDAPLFECSLPLGSQRLRAMLADSCPSQLTPLMRRAFAPIFEAVAELAPDRVVFASGTARAVHKLVRQRCSLGAGHWVEPPDLRAVVEWARSAKPSQLREAGVPTYRLPTIAISASVIDLFASVLGASQVWVSRRGLRDGVVARELGRAADHRPVVVAAEA